MDIDYNTYCYDIKKYNYDKGILDDSVDATYIIHLKDNGRIEHVLEQLKEYHPTKIVYIVYNDGFKKCNKKLIEQISYQDLTDAFLQCFKHANNKNYNNILILEDDFIFSPKIKNAENIKSLNTFLNEKKDQEFIYYLGCNPILICPYSSNLEHYKAYKSLSMHSVVYSKKARIAKLNVNLKHWDVIVEKGIKNRYLYYEALCYQTYPDTENKVSWSEKDNILIGNLKNIIIKLLNLDNKPEPGFTIIYVIAKIITLIIFFILFAILFYILSYFVSCFTSVKLNKYKK